MTRPTNREWKPGDVAMVTVHLGEGSFRTCRAMRDESGWQTGTEWLGSSLNEVASVRPLVVIDPEDRDQAAQIIAAFSDQFTSWSTDGERDAEKMQAALRSLLEPPKPDEPKGLGAVVRVPSRRGADFGSQLLVRAHATHQPWLGDGIKQDWDEIEGPVEVLSEGVPA